MFSVQAVLTAVGVFLSRPRRSTAATPCICGLFPHACACQKLLPTHLQDPPRAAWWPLPVHSPAGSRAALPLSHLCSASPRLCPQDLWSPLVLVTCHCSSEHGCQPADRKEETGAFCSACSTAPLPAVEALSRHVCMHCPPHGTSWVLARHGGPWLSRGRQQAGRDRNAMA